jgi:DNA-binding NtrC family response regulator
MARNRKILLLDDDAQTRDTLERALVEANYGVVSALDGSDALRQVQQHSIDVAVLGLGRDTENDWNTVQRLTQNQPRLRFIVAGADSEGFAHPLASTAEALLEKPIDLPLLFETLKGLPGNSPVADHTACGQDGTCYCQG